MERSRIWLGALGFCALTMACGDAGARRAIQMARIEPPAQPVTSVDAVTPGEPAASSPVPSSATQTPAAEAAVPTAAPNAASPRAGAIPVLSQMLTAQALIVSLLLTPFPQEQPGRSRASQPLASGSL